MDRQQHLGETPLLPAATPAVRAAPSRARARQALARWLRRLPLAWVALALSLAATAFAWSVADHAVRARAEERFGFQVLTLANSIAKRLLEYESALRGGAGLFNASGKVSREEWRRFVAELRIQQNFPGVQGMGFSLMMRAADRDRHVAQTRGEGFPDYAIKPAGVRDPVSSVIYIEPFDWRNQRAFGFDMYSEPVRRAAMMRAVDSGETSVSGRVKLVQETAEDAQYGFLMYVPVYRKGMAVDSVAERRAAIQGFVYSPFRCRDLIEGIFGSERPALDFEIHDASPLSAEHLLYASRPGAGGSASAGSGSFETLVDLPVGDRFWSLAVRAPAGFVSAEEEIVPLAIAGTGIALNLMLYFIVAAVVRQKRKVEHDARQLAEQLSDSQARYGALFQAAKTPMLLIDPQDGAIVECNPAATRFYGYDKAALEKMSIADLNTLPFDQWQLEMQAASEASREHFFFAHRLASGERREVEVHAGPFRYCGKTILYSIIHDVTRRRRIEAALVASEKRYGYVMAATGEGVWDWDVASNVVTHNAGWCHILGLDEKMLHHPLEAFTTLVHADDRAAIAEAIDSALHDDKPYYSRHRMCCPDGRTIWVRDRGRVVERAGDGAALRMVGSMADISERKAIEDALADERSQLKTLLDTASDAIHVLDGDGRVVICSRSFAQMLGYSVEEAQQLNVRQWDAQLSEDDLVRSLQQRPSEPHIFETRHRRRDGSIIDVEIAAKGVQLFGRDYFYASARDVSERKRQDAQIRRQQARLQNIIEGTRAGTWEWNVRTGQLVLNERGAEIVGRTLADLAPLTIASWSKLVHPDDLPEALARIEAHFAHRSDYFESEARLQHQDGHWVWLLARGRVSAWSENGKPLTMVGTHQDVSDRKAIEQGLSEARLAAEASNRAKSQFLANMSHEIRTPMNGVLGMAQLLLMPGLDAEERDDYVRTIYNSGRSLLALLNDILDLAKVEAGKVELERLAFSPQQLLQELASLFEEACREKGLALVLDSQGLPANSRHWGDPLRLRQILSNFLANAVKFTARGSVGLRAECLAGPAGTLLRMAVHDTGIGIAPEECSRLFQAFSQVDGTITRRFGGTGLGLAIARNLCELMGGTIGVDSLPGEGSTFWIEIPTETVTDLEDSRAANRAAAHLARPAAQLAGHGRSILLVEDVETNRAVVSAYLSKRGFFVEAVENGQQAVEHISCRPLPDLVLMDCHMPVMDGLEATRQIRAWEAGTAAAAGEAAAAPATARRRTRLPILALTASVLANDRQCCLDAGMDDFIAKPVSFSALDEQLARWLAIDITAASTAPAASAPLPDAASGVALADALLSSLGPRFCELDGLLERHLMQAKGLARELSEALAGSRHESGFAPVAATVRALDFAAARRQLRGFAGTAMTETNC